MDYFDLKREDGEDAFIGWEPVNVAKEVGDIPEKFHPYFADQCDCGSENIIKMNLSTVTCFCSNTNKSNSFSLYCHSELFCLFLFHLFRSR